MLFLAMHVGWEVPQGAAESLGSSVNPVHLTGLELDGTTNSWRRIHVFLGDGYMTGPGGA